MDDCCSESHWEGKKACQCFSIHRLHFIQFPTVKRLLQVKLRTFWRKHDKDLIVAHELFGECVMCPIGSKAAANLCRDGVDFNLQFWSFGTLHQLICQCMKGDTFS